MLISINHVFEKISIIIPRYNEEQIFSVLVENFLAVNSLGLERDRRD